MNRRGAGRAYESPLRAEQMEQTHARIVDAAVELLAEDVAELTIPLVARRARVAVRTVYRHFPTKEALLAEISGLMDRSGGTPFPDEIAELPGTAPRLFAFWDENQALVRAVLNSRAGRDVRTHRRQVRIESLERLLAPLLEGADPVEARAMTAVFYALQSTTTWRMMGDYFGLAGADSGRAVAWAVETLLADLRRSGARRRRA